ncbi:MAG: Nramp family divalent metal transporter, partial [Acetobacteraceae bacterium]|nr:Nramp family divalent metal transporter [Acetobacteraceae bacterium]
GALTIGVGIIGATVMPHAIFLHSSLTQDRITVSTEAERRLLIRYSNREVVVSLTVAGMINVAMVAIAASVIHIGHEDVAEIETAYRTLVPLLGGGAATVFLLSLIASGMSSSVVGTMAGQVIMQGFIGFRIPVLVRRLATMAPAFVIIAMGANPTEALVLSQVVLSIALPVPMIALLVLTRRRSVMGEYATTQGLSALALAATVLVLSLNVLLTLQILGVPLPFLS